MTARRAHERASTETPEATADFALAARQGPWIAFSVLVAATLAVYWPLLLPGFEFLSWDDTTNIVENPFVNDPGAVDLGTVFTSRTLGVYEPLAVSLKLGIVALFGMSVRPFHVVALLLHAANACLLFLVARRLVELARPADRDSDARAKLAALCAALFYALHPLRVEAVGWASGQSYVLATTFSLLALASYLQHCRALRARGTEHGFSLPLLLSAVAYACAVMSKSAAIFLPVVLLLLDAFPLQRGGWPRLVIEKAGYGGIALAAAGMALLATAGAQESNPFDLDLGTRLAYALRSFVFHLRLSLWPDPLLPTYPVTATVARPFDESFLLYTVAFTALCVAAWRLRERAPWFGVSWLGYLAGILPVSGIVAHGAWTLGADRYTMLTTFGLYIVLGAALTSPALVPKLSWQEARARGVAVVVALALCILGIAAHRQLQHWRSSEALWAHTLARDPANPVALNNLGYLYIQDRRYDDAAQLLATAVAVRPENLPAVLNLGFALEKAGRLEEALGSYKRALRRHEDAGALHNNLAVVYRALGDEEESRRHADRAAALEFR